MEKLTKTQIAVFIGWCFLHIILFSIGSGYKVSDKCKGEFWPFQSNDNSDCMGFYGAGKLIAAYNATELLVYIGLPVVGFFIMGLIKADEANKDEKKD